MQDKSIHVQVVSSRGYDDVVLDIMVKDLRDYAIIARHIMVNSICISTGADMEANRLHIEEHLYKARMNDSSVFIIEGAEGKEYTVYLRQYQEVEKEED